MPSVPPVERCISVGQEPSLYFYIDTRQLMSRQFQSKRHLFQNKAITPKKNHPAVLALWECVTGLPGLKEVQNQF